MKEKFVMIDLETSALNANIGSIIRYTAMKMGDCSAEIFDKLAKPNKPLTPKMEGITELSNAQLDTCQNTDIVKAEFLDFICGCVVVGYNLAFEESFLGLDFPRKIELLRLGFRKIR